MAPHLLGNFSLQPKSTYSSTNIGDFTFLNYLYLHLDRKLIFALLWRVSQNLFRSKCVRCPCVATGQSTPVLSMQRRPADESTVVALPSAAMCCRQLWGPTMWLAKKAVEAILQAANCSSKSPVIYSGRNQPHGLDWSSLHLSSRSWPLPEVPASVKFSPTPDEPCRNWMWRH